MKATLLLSAFAGVVSIAQAQVIHLSGTSYSEDFNGLGSGLPNGWSVAGGATLSGNGTAAGFTTSPTSWSDSSGGFKNFASANNPGAQSSDSSATQAAYADRALGLRQVAALDPGAAFVAELADTAGFHSFQLGLDLQILDVEARSTTWTLDYRMGGSGDFTPLGTYPDPGVWGSAHRDFSFGSALDDQSESVFIRVAALTGSSGSGSRDSFAMDNFSLTYTAVPEPSLGGILVGLGLLGFGAVRVASRKRKERPDSRAGRRLG